MKVSLVISRVAQSFESIARKGKLWPFFKRAFFKSLFMVHSSLTTGTVKWLRLSHAKIKKLPKAITIK